MATSQQQSKTTDHPKAGIPAANGTGKKAKTKTPKMSAAQKRDVQMNKVASCIDKAAQRLKHIVDPAPGVDPYVVAVATTNSVLASMAGALDAKVRLSAEDVRTLARAFMQSAKVEEVEAPMGGTTFQRIDPQ